MSEQVRDSYDRAATAYAEALLHELDGKPLDRWLLGRLATDAVGPIGDIGCGPGHISDWLSRAGASVVGIDLSPGMVAEAERRFPMLSFEVGDLWSLRAERFGGIAAMYSLVHTTPDALAGAFAALERALAPGGVLLAAAHLGDGILHVDELLGAEVDLDFVMFRRPALCEAARTAGLVVVEDLERGPYPDVEHPSRRAYVYARKPPN